MNRLSILVGSLYVRKYFSEESKKDAVEMVDNIRNEFIKILHNVRWMDDGTRVKAIKKAESLTTHMGYPVELLDNDKIEQYFENLTTMQPDDLLMNTLRLRVFDTDRKFHLLHQSINKTDWKAHSIPTVVNAYYNEMENSICKLLIGGS